MARTKREQESPPPAPAQLPDANALLRGSDRRIEYVTLDSLTPALRNPKLHAEAALDKSVGRFGYTEPVLLDERTGRLVAGHGRLQALQRLQAKGALPPDGVRAQEGIWSIPVVRGWSSRSDQEAEAYLLASNQLTIAGGWDEAGLRAILESLKEAEATEGMGWTEGELDKLLQAQQEIPYTDKVAAPVYQPTGERPAVSDLYDAQKRVSLCADIDAAEDITEEERAFLRLAAQRHIVFNYQRIAEYYAHADAPMQRLMEQSALVIIDFKQAIERGFVKMTEHLAEDMGAEEDEA